MAAILCNIQKDDEVIMPSYTFVSTANAFVLRGAKIVFVDIRPDTMNINEDLIENAITAKTKAIVPVHYAGISCNMEKISKLAQKYNLFVIEDAAQSIFSKYKNVNAGTFGTFAALSFHETKNLTCGEGGAILINKKEFVDRAEIIREKGTNRSRFLRGEVDKYSWVDIGSSYLPSELNAAYLLAQLESYQEVQTSRVNAWVYYHENLTPLCKTKQIQLPAVPEECTFNGHIYYIKVKDLAERIAIIEFLKKEGIQATSHYVPLHSSIAGEKITSFNGEDIYTTKESERLLRLPMFFNITKEQQDLVIKKIYEFFKE